ncbi:MAG TPA: valine--tRNA ligase [Pyrinomonadaceae bacterium]
MEIPKTYDPRQAEEQHYARWERAGCFAPEANRDESAPVYSIVIPPPNVTGSLHMGHALQHTIMDVLARYHRMRGKRTLWVIGTDHAGISTQIVVERELKKEGLSRHDLGREKFIERVWEWKQRSGGRITEQMRREGASVDWSRERFTMDDDLSRAVREFFVRCHDEGLIYRGERLINWCPKDQTALSDLEVDKETQKGQLWHLQYPVKGSDERRVTVATTRPETMLGDTAVAVNPDDERYQDLIGATLMLPLTGREIPIVADAAVDPAFGTGAVKVTPAHDPTDYEIGERHNLPQIVVIDKHARMTEAAGAEFAGLDRYEAREKVVQKFEELGLLERVADYEGAVSRCDRCRTVIEPLISLQWFCKQRELAEKGLELIRERHEPHFVPEVPWEKVYTDWLEGLHDWTLSRQLWWGHRIPAWYDEEGNVYVARSEEDARVAAGADKLTQDPDVLDTWFSSALWPISTLGWPEETSADLKTFYPTDVLVTAREIIFLWVSRMVMTGTKFIGPLPFRDVVITGLVLDKHGKKMSKSKPSDAVDPMDVFEKYGVDATRITLASSPASTGTDSRWRDEQVESYRNFANKIWNAARFCLMNSEGAQVGKGFEGDPSGWALHDRWIMSELNRTAREVSRAVEGYQFHEAVYSLYHFFWDDFCDWYIELTKQDVTASEPTPARDAARSRVVTVLETALRLLHPFMPFITEELWQRLPGVGADSLHPAYRGMEPTVMLTEYPRADESLIDERAESEMRAVIELVSRVRNIRTELNVKPSEEVRLIISAGGDGLGRVFDASLPQIKRLVRASEVSFKESMADAPRASARAALAGGAELAVPFEGLIDFGQETARLGKEIEKLSKELERLEAQLANPQFVERAPAEKVEELRQRSEDIRQRIVALEQMLEALKG